MYKANFVIQIPEEINIKLNMIAAKKQILKREAIAEAIKQYVEREK